MNKVLPHEIPGADPLEAVMERYAYKITDHVVSTIKGPCESDPVARQYLPQSAELDQHPEEYADPIGDGRHSPVKGIVHRHPDRVLLKLANICAVYCRFCFRREQVGPGGGVLNTQERRAALDYIASHPEIQEVILTGGDPLILSPQKLSGVLKRLDEIRNVHIIRLHTRIPIADPRRITPDLCRILVREKPVYMVLHVNHPQEVTSEVERALKGLKEAGCLLLSQSVLLKGVNDDAETLERLFRALSTLGVKPYYLHHPDLAPGTNHFRPTLREGRALMKRLQGRVSGISLPAYVLDIPGGYGKVLVNADYVEDLGNGTYLIEDAQGRKHPYPPRKGARHE